MSISANSPPETQRNRMKFRICQSNSILVGGLRAQRPDWLHAVGADELDVAECPVADAFDQVLAVAQWRHIRPAAILRFFFSAASPALIMRRKPADRAQTISP